MISLIYISGLLIAHQTLLCARDNTGLQLRLDDL
jgi:hypothetical protein